MKTALNITALLVLGWGLFLGGDLYGRHQTEQKYGAVFDELKETADMLDAFVSAQQMVLEKAGLDLQPVSGFKHMSEEPAVGIDVLMARSRRLASLDSTWTEMVARNEWAPMDTIPVVEWRP